MRAGNPVHFCPTRSFTFIAGLLKRLGPEALGLVRGSRHIPPLS
jgi:hypothetical protein